MASDIYSSAYGRKSIAIFTKSFLVLFIGCACGKVNRRTTTSTKLAIEVSIDVHGSSISFKQCTFFGAHCELNVLAYSEKDVTRADIQRQDVHFSGHLQSVRNPSLAQSAKCLLHFTKTAG